jgi:hypothetical protein
LTPESERAREEKEQEEGLKVCKPDFGVRLQGEKSGNVFGEKWRGRRQKKSERKSRGGGKEE